MRINGNDYGLMMTTEAAVEIAKLCPGEDLMKVGQLFGKSYATRIDALLKVVPILSAGFAANEAYNGRHAEQITEKAIRALPFSAIVGVLDEVWETINRDISGEVRTKPAPGTKSKKDKTEAEA